MLNTRYLKDWYYFRSSLTNRDVLLNKIKNKYTLDSLQLELQPFIVPGSLQFSMSKILDIDPYFEKNMEKFLAYEYDVILLVCEVSLTERENDLFIHFEYIDTISEIFLNGELIGKSENFHIRYFFPIPETLLRQGKNLFSVIISPSLAEVEEDADLPEIQDRVFVRRPAVNYGWDFAPRAILIAMGTCSLFQKGRIYLSDVFVITNSCDEQKAELTIEWCCETTEAHDFNFNLGVTLLRKDIPIHHEKFLHKLNIGKTIIKRRVLVERPNLWWPNGHGNPDLYQLEIEEKSTGTSIKTTFGIRKIDLILEEKGHKRFLFKINGKRIWAKGANWVPSDALTNFSDRNKYRTLLSLAKDANFNMIRIWGGGVVENQIFYELCDQMGLMIWHDFQFACSVYPETKTFTKNVENEITDILKRLRNHPSIVLWCGNNENEWIDYQKFTEGYRKERKIGVVFHLLKKRLCQQLDPTRPYWRSSPWSPSSETSYSFNPNSQDEGNCHDWFVWHGVAQPNLEPPEYEAYAKNRARFISEFGIQSLPVKETIDRIFSLTTQAAPNDVWEFHNCNLSKIQVNLKKFGQPQTIDEWILYTQAAQAFGLKFAIEIWRSRKFETAGSLIWQFNEPWPTICWSLIDYYNRPKMAYWFVKRAFAPLIVLQDSEGKKIIVVNDDNRNIKGTLLVQEYSLREGNLIYEKQCQLSINENDKIEVGVNQSNLSKASFRWISFSSEDYKAENLVLPLDPIKINFPNPEVVATLEREKKILTLKSNKLAFIVELTSKYQPDDNYFHLIPNIPRKIRLNRLPKESKIELTIWNQGKRFILFKNC